LIAILFPDPLPGFRERTGLACRRHQWEFMPRLDGRVRGDDADLLRQYAWIGRRVNDRSPSPSSAQPLIFDVYGNAAELYVWSQNLACHRPYLIQPLGGSYIFSSSMAADWALPDGDRLLTRPRLRGRLSPHPGFPVGANVK
jgi:hypothetical protein